MWHRSTKPHQQQHQQQHQLYNRLNAHSQATHNCKYNPFLKEPLQPIKEGQISLFTLSPALSASTYIRISWERFKHLLMQNAQNGNSKHEFRHFTWTIFVAVSLIHTHTHTWVYRTLHSSHMVDQDEDQRTICPLQALRHSFILYAVIFTAHTHIHTALLSLCIYFLCI